MHRSTAASTYARNAVLTASPEKIVVMLYDRAIQQTDRARSALVAADGGASAHAGEAIGRAFAIVGELRNTLASDQGDIATKLDRLYEFALDKLTLANQTQNPAALDDALTVLRTLKEGWDGIITGA